MTKSRIYLPITLVLLLLPFCLLFNNKAVADSDSVTVSIDHDDGGRTSDSYMDDLLVALNKNGCKTVLSHNKGINNAQLLFDSRPVSITKQDRTDYHLIAQAKTLEGKLTVRGAFLVHASTGIENLSTLQGMSIAFIGKKSWSGYHMPMKSLQAAGVKEEMNTFFYVPNHVGAISMLMHSDVFATVTAAPLARRWAEANDLSIVALTDSVETGGWWMHRSTSKDQIKSCSTALSKMGPSQLKALPVWIGGFKINL